MFDEKIVSLEQLLASIKNPAIIKDKDSSKTSTILVKGELPTNPRITLYLNFFGKLDRGSSHMHSRAYDDYLIYKNINKLLQMTYNYKKRQTPLVYKITPNVSKYVATYQIKNRPDLDIKYFIEHPEFNALPSYDGWKRDKDAFFKGQWAFNTLCIITSSVEFPLSQVLFTDKTIILSDFKAMLYQICHLEACFEDIKLTHSKPHYMVEKHEAPIDLYYQHNNKDECVLIRTRYVIKLSKFDEAMISENTKLADGVEISSIDKKQQFASDNFQFIQRLLKEYMYIEDLHEFKISMAEVKLISSIMDSSNNLNDKLNLLSKDNSVRLEQASASGQPIYCTSKIFLSKKAQIEAFMASDYGRNDFLSHVRNFHFPDINPFIEQDNAKLTEIAQVLMKNTLKSVLEALLLCYRHYKTDKKIFYLLLMGGLVGLFQNEILIACGVTDNICINWVGQGTKCRKAVPGFENKYQWVFFDMVKRTEKLVKAQKNRNSINLPYNPDSSSIFDMCYYVLEGKEGYAANRDMEANCILSSLLEGCYFQEVEKLPLNRIFIGLETAKPGAGDYERHWKSLSSLRNNNFPQNQRHPTQGKYATHWTSKIQENSGSIKTFRSVLPKCGPRNLNFGEHFEYIAQSVAYSQISILTRKLKNTFDNDKDNKKLYVATQLNGILFLLLRATLESKTPLNDIYKDYVANAGRDANFFHQKPPSATMTRELFQKYYTGINDELVGLVGLVEEKMTMRWVL